MAYFKRIYLIIFIMTIFSGCSLFQQPKKIVKVKNPIVINKVVKTKKIIKTNKSAKLTNTTKAEQTFSENKNYVVEKIDSSKYYIKQKQIQKKQWTATKYKSIDETIFKD